MNKRDFMVIGSVRGNGQRQTVAIYNTHDFHAFSALCRADTISTTFGWREGRIDETLAFIYRAGFAQCVCQLV